MTSLLINGFDISDGDKKIPMKSTWFNLLLLSLLLSAVLAPFAGLAPLMLILLIAGVGSIVGSLVQVLIFGGTKDNQPDTQKH